MGFVAVAPLVALARGMAGGPTPLGRGLRWGFLAGLAAFAPLVSWLVPFGFAAFGLLTLIQSGWVALYVALLSAWGERRGRAVVAVVTWVAIEAVRSGWPLSGFGWGVLGYTQHDGGLALGVARTFGVFGVSTVLATIGVAAEQVVDVVMRRLPEARGSDNPGDVVFGALRTPLLTILGVATLAVLVGGEAPTPSGEEVEVAIVQAGDTRATGAAGVNRIDSDRIERVARLALEATLPLADDPPDLVVWPENSLDIDVRTEAGAEIRALLDRALEAVAPAPILAGEYSEGPRPRTLYNRMTVYTVDGAQDSYVKRRPVPFGEYVPARDALDWFPPLEQIPNDTLAGADAQVLDVADARVGAVICFENTFPDLVRDQVLAGADVLVVGTNNSSFGDGPMSRQHLAFSRLRAVETGRWVVHAGISGISGFVSPEGELSQATELFTPATPRMSVPLVDGLTPAMRLGGLVPWVAQALTAAAVAVLVVQAVRARTRRRRPEGGAVVEE